MARISALTGVDPGFLLNLDEQQLAAVQEVAVEESRRRSWTNDTELLASVVDLLAAILARLNAGIPVGMVKKLSTPSTPTRVKRPVWTDDPDDDTATVSPRDFFSMMRG